MIKYISKCRLCESVNIKNVISFGLCALANSYPDSENLDNQDRFSLSVVKCDECGHVQLSETIDPIRLFKNYFYASSDSPSLIKHFSDYAIDIKKRIFGNTEKKVLEIGCNDGILLNAFFNIGMETLIGVDPAENVIGKSKNNNAINLISDFFNVKTSENIVNRFGKIDVICANNVMAHVDKLDELMRGVVNSLDDKGIVVIENAYLLDTINNVYFDQVYHEHLQYYGIAPLERYLKKYGLDIFDVIHVPTQGGSFRIFAKKTENLDVKIKETVSDFKILEFSNGLYDDETYFNFNKKIELLKNDMERFMEDIKSRGKTVSCYGCPAKFALFSKVFNLNSENIKYVVDDAKIKQGRFSPGSNIPIVNKEHFEKNPTDYCIISVWNMANAIIDKNSGYVGKFVLPLPSLKIVK